jgi:hypothetical protein
MEFMFGELMTRSNRGCSKKGREAKKEEIVARNSAD